LGRADSADEKQVKPKGKWEKDDLVYHEKGGGRCEEKKGKKKRKERRAGDWGGDSADKKGGGKKNGTRSKKKMKKNVMGDNGGKPLRGKGQDRKNKIWGLQGLWGGDKQLVHGLRSSKRKLSQKKEKEGKRVPKIKGELPVTSYRGGKVGIKQ